jgi:hypothetical protein
VEQVRALDVGQRERAGDRLEDGVRLARGVAALEPRVVVDADPGEERDLLAAEARYAPVVAVPGQACLLGG